MSPERPKVDYDEVEEALTEMWMANTLCLTFLTLNAIGFACLVWAVPVIAETLAAQRKPPEFLTGALLGLGRAAAAAPWITGICWAGLSLGAVALQASWSNRRGKIRTFFVASLVPLGVTLAICATALLA